MKPTRSRAPRVAAAALLAIGSVFVLGAAAVGCEKKMDPAECDKIKAEAFTLLGKGQPCGTDADCKEATWPQCRRPTNLKNIEALAEMQKKRTDGKCEEKPAEECKDSPEVYCKQGLCVNREIGEVRDRE